MEEKGFNVVLVVGSARIQRETHKVANYLEQTLRQHNVLVNIVDLKKTPLPIMEERYELIEHESAEVHEIAKKLKDANAIVFISPEYTGTVSGVLKNAIDYFARLMNGKPIGVVTTSNGKLGGISASHQMQHIILSMNAFPMPYKLLVSEIANAFDENLNPIREDIKITTHRFVQEFVPFAKAINAMKSGKFALT